jgi:hypothetical protein
MPPEPDQVAGPAGLDALRMAFDPAIPREDSLGIELDNLVTGAITLFQRDYPGVPFRCERGMLRQLEDLFEVETNPARKRGLFNLINGFRAHFNLYDPDKPAENDGQVKIFVSRDRLTALLTVTSPRGIGNMPTLNTVQALLDRARIVFGVDTAAIEHALHEIRDRKDVVWCMPIAHGEPARAGRLGRIAFRVPVLDKPRMARDVAAMASWLLPLWAPVEAGAIVGSLTDASPPAPGKDIFGAILPPPESELALDLGDDLKLVNHDTLVASAPGYVVADDARVDLMPVYVMKSPSSKTLREFTFPGVILVEGNLQGPGSLECDDLIVLGNVEQVSVSCRGDIFIAGGVIGHHQTTLDADGRIAAAFISEAKLSALREITAANAIINSQVISNTTIRVLSDKGMIAGGKLYSLKEIVSATIGSEFGMLTETIVGKDFLSSSRLEEITNLIHTHEENLRRIQALKEQIQRSRVRLESMPPDKQEIYIGILRKEQNSLGEMKSLLRRKKTLSRGLQDFLEGSIQVLNNLYPPVRVQIGNAIRDIRQKLNAVTLKYDEALGIVSQAPAAPTGETPHAPA